jgi:phosphatidylglycerophosphate synthase
MTSILFLLTAKSYPLIAMAFLILTLILDWLDGVIARKFGTASYEGYLTDVASDRFSEGIIFLGFFFPWFYLFCLNCALSLVSVKMRRHLILPLRHAFLVFYAFLLLSGGI